MLVWLLVYSFHVNDIRSLRVTIFCREVYLFCSSTTLRSAYFPPFLRHKLRCLFFQIIFWMAMKRHFRYSKKNFDNFQLSPHGSQVFLLSSNHFRFFNVYEYIPQLFIISVLCFSTITYLIGRILFWCLTWGSNPGFTSNKSTRYLLDYGNLYKCK